MTGWITAATLTTLVAALAWRWNERRNAREVEHNSVTGRGWQA